MAQSSRMSAAAPPQLLLAENLARRFGGIEAVRDVQLSLARGRVLGLLGVNGAGKTTTLKLLAGLLAPDRGRVLVQGRDVTRDPRAQRALVAYAPETPALHRDATPREALGFAARLRGMRGAACTTAVGKSLSRCDLAAVADRLIGKLSRGQQQRVGLAQALVHEPALVLLDEPTAGLDPVQAAATREWIAGLREHAAVIVSTHLLGDVRACCDEVAVLHEGAIAFSGALDQWIADDSMELRLDRAVDAQFFASLGPRKLEAGTSGQHWWLSLDPAQIPAISRHAASQGVGVTLLRRREDALERRFVDLVAGRAARDSAIDAETTA